ncbi:hypothetical protein [Ideonella paludis]|uniref:hypothetical protein n=1 Tax=Ideonella paludis TaxID=1233411 RepID=UPI00362C9341
MKFVALLLCGLVVMSGAMQTAQAQDKVPVEDFFRKSKLAGVTLSPDGKHLAFVAPSTMGDDRMVLAMASVESPQKWTVVAHMRDADVSTVDWVNNSRLVFRVSDRQSTMGEQKGAGLYAVNLDGSEFVWLIAREYGEQDHPIPSKRPLLYNHVYVRTIGDGSDDVLGTLYDRLSYVGEPTYSRPIRLNTKTKGSRSLKTTHQRALEVGPSTARRRQLLS